MDDQKTMGLAQDTDELMSVSVQRYYEEKERLKRSLNTAVMLGTMYREPVVIKYRDENGNHLKKETIVISATEFFVVLKGGETIPVKRVDKVLA